MLIHFMERNGSESHSISFCTNIEQQWWHLQELGLNEVFSGGLSSYSVVNMVMAYLSLEGMSLAQHMQPGSGALLEISHTISSPPAAQQDVAWRLQQTFSEPSRLASVQRTTHFLAGRALKCGGHLSKRPVVC